MQRTLFFLYEVLLGKYIYLCVKELQPSMGSCVRGRKEAMLCKSLVTLLRLRMPVISLQFGNLLG